MGIEIIVMAWIGFLYLYGVGIIIVGFLLFVRYIKEFLKLGTESALTKQRTEQGGLTPPLGDMKEIIAWEHGWEAGFRDGVNYQKKWQRGEKAIFGRKDVK